MVEKIKQQGIRRQPAFPEKKIKKHDQQGNRSSQKASGGTPPNQIQKIVVFTFLDGIIVKNVNHYKKRNFQNPRYFNGNTRINLAYSGKNS